MLRDNPSRMPGVAERATATNTTRGHYAKHAERMRGSTLCETTRDKIAHSAARSAAAQLAERMTEREKVMAEALSFDPLWVPQHLLGRAVLDFARPDIKLCLELDNGTKERETERRDALVVAQGWTVVRFNCAAGLHAGYYARAIRVAAKLVPGFECPDELPADAGRRYRVLVRCPEAPAGLHVHGPDDPALARLAAARRDAPEPAAVRKRIVTD
jgi:very-short-patch-repair endonuclease